MADARNRANVYLGAPDVNAQGGVFIGVANPAKTAYPTDAVTALKSTDLKLTAAGFISEDGVSRTIDRSTDKIKDWNGDTVMIVQSDHSVTLSLTFLETANPAVLKTLFGTQNVEVTGSKVTVKDNADELPHVSLVFEILGGNGKRIRLFAPDAQATEVSDVTYSRSDIVKYEATFECFSDADNNKLYQFYDAGTTTTGTSS